MSKRRSKNYVKKPRGFKTLRENKEVSKYIIRHARHGCYEVILQTGEKMAYLTNFKNKKAAEKFVEAHENDEVTIDPETCIPKPDFK